MLEPTSKPATGFMQFEFGLGGNGWSCLSKSRQT
jgi:hypothetical protein